MGKTFDEYRNLRESGYSKDEATFIMAKKAPMYIFSAKADDYIGKNSRIYEVLYGKNGIVDKADDFRYNGTGDIFLQNKLSYNLNGKKMFIPKQAKFENVVTLAGKGEEKPIKDIKRLVFTYGGDENNWKKQAGKINSEKICF